MEGRGGGAAQCWSLRHSVTSGWATQATNDNRPNDEGLLWPKQSTSIRDCYTDGSANGQILPDWFGTPAAAFVSLAWLGNVATPEPQLSCTGRQVGRFAMSQSTVQYQGAKDPIDQCINPFMLQPRGVSAMSVSCQSFAKASICACIAHQPWIA